jgi:NifU-like protein involved in Fe-S cluster formation
VASAADIYQQAIKSLAAEATGRGRLESPSGRAFLDNPLCGDCVEMQVLLADGRIRALAHEVKGCLLCRAAASAIGKRAPGAALSDIERIGAQVAAMLREGSPAPAGWDELAVFAPVHGHPSRYRCVQLPFEALAAAMQPADP